MPVFDPKNNPAICVLPWVHEYRDINGKIAPCCVGKELRDNENLETIRQQMINRTQPRACAKCYLKEEESGYSERIFQTTEWIQKFGAPDITKDPTVQYLDIRYDATCNLKCKTCGPLYSTLWQKEKKVSLPNNASNKDYLDKVDKTNLKKVYLAGGEPTYIKGYLTFLEELYVVNPLCEVIINSNLKRLPDVWKTIIKKFKNLTITCSCDSTGTLGTYVRYPLDQEEFTENVRFVSEHANFVQFNLVASNLTSHKLYETCTWMKQFTKHINISILRNPICMSEGAVPMEHRRTYIENIEKLTKFPVSAHVASNFRSKIQYLIYKYSNTKYDASLHEQLTAEITEQDSHRTLQLKDVDPFLNGWIHG